MNLTNDDREAMRYRLGWERDADPAEADRIIDAATPLQRARWWSGWHLGSEDWADEFARILGVDE